MDHPQPVASQRRTPFGQFENLGCRPLLRAFRVMSEGPATLVNQIKMLRYRQQQVEFFDGSKSGNVHLG